MTLYLVSTPIGNLDDFSFRAVKTLQSCDLILCEDTRHSKTLLKHYDIEKPCLSYQKFNEKEREEKVLTALRDGKKIALISDAGTPGISDPGEALVRLCREEGILVTAAPGASALIYALSISGLPTAPFQFLGFLPKKSGDRDSSLNSALEYLGTSIFYESPHRIEKTLQRLHELATSRKICIARELSKRYEEVLSGTAQDLLKHCPMKGEIVLLIEGASDGGGWEELSLEEHVDLILEKEQCSLNDAIKKAAKMRGIPKREAYSQIRKL